MNYQYDRYWGTFTKMNYRYDRWGTFTKPAILGVGYSGKSIALNDPSDDNQHEVGPIPAGWYTVNGPFNMGSSDKWEHPSLGHGPVWELVPDPTNQMNGRSGFFIHGDNGARNHSASEGCVIVPPFYRSIFMKGDRVKVI